MLWVGFDNCTYTYKLWIDRDREAQVYDLKLIRVEVKDDQEMKGRSIFLWENPPKDRTCESPF